jgi:hypothetical protein
MKTIWQTSFVWLILQFYNFQASLNRMANACSCLFQTKGFTKACNLKTGAFSPWQLVRSNKRNNPILHLHMSHGHLKQLLSFNIFRLFFSFPFFSFLVSGSRITSLSFLHSTIICLCLSPSDANKQTDKQNKKLIFFLWIIVPMQKIIWMQSDHRGSKKSTRRQHSECQLSGWNFNLYFSQTRAGCCGPGVERS